MTAVSGLAQNFWHLLLARIGVGAGEAGCHLPPTRCSRTISQQRTERRSWHLLAGTFGILLDLSQVAG